MNYQQALDYTHSLTRFGVHPGLDRINKLLDLLGNPQNKLKCIHVAGTNGKGSTVNLISSVLGAAGYRVGMYTSPFVVDFRERIQICGEYITEQDYAAYATEVSTAVKSVPASFGDVTEFEFVTAVAFLYFCKSQVDFAVIEVGLGGRLDATNVIESPLVNIITTISFDHTDILGDTIEKITLEKCGIIKSGAECVCGYQEYPEVYQVVSDQCRLKNAVYFQYTENLFADIECQNGMLGFSYNEKKYNCALVGRYQIYNLFNLFKTIELINQKCHVNISTESVQKGLVDCRLPGRFEIFKLGDKTVIFDCGHNPDGIKKLTEALEFFAPDRKPTAICGMLADKDVKSSVLIISNHLSRVYCVTPISHRALKAEELADIYSTLNIPTDVIKLNERDLSAVIQDNDFILVFGSFYTVSPFREWFIKLL